ncbi:hypothetical protein KJ684_02695 [Patescibacteria group bacterium]|nr:hypothetical protein [Patescibacteria group bacterium]
MDNNKQEQEEKTVPEQIKEQSIQPTKKQNPKWFIPAIIVVGIIVLGAIAYGAYSLLKPEVLPSGDLSGKECNNLWWYDNEHNFCQEPEQFCGLYMYNGLETFKTKEECENSIASKDKFKDWKTYTNEEYGFEFKYPIESVSLGSLVFSDKGHAGCQNTDGGKCNNPSRHIIGVSRCFTVGGFSCDDSSGFSVEVFFDLNEFAGIRNRWATGANDEIKMFDVQIGEVWGQMVNNPVSGAQHITYFAQVDSYGFIISVNNVSNQRVSIDEMTKIFSTFKFLD